MSASKMDQRVRLNVGGQYFETTAMALSSLPGTKLSQLSPSDPSYDAERQEYFFDRNPRLFPYVLDAYREEEMHFPKCLCVPALLRELSWWGIGAERVAPCCLKVYSDWDEEQRMLAVVDAACGRPKDCHQEGGVGERSWRRYMRSVWVFLEDESSSKIARVWSIFYVAVLVLSIIVISLETVRDLRVSMSQKMEDALGDLPNIVNQKLDMYITTEEHPALYYINILCLLFFLIELSIRFITCPEKLFFVCSFFNIIDMLAIFPACLFTFVNLIHPYYWVKNNLELAYILVGLSAIFRAVRVLKMFKHNRSLQVIFLAVKASMKEMLLLGLLVIICSLIFSIAVYYAELYSFRYDGYDSFPSIPDGLYWSIITLTTVGYGDVIPASRVGHIISGVCAVCGMLLFVLPIPVIVNNFRLYYSYVHMKPKHDQNNTPGKVAKEI